MALLIALVSAAACGSHARALAQRDVQAIESLALTTLFVRGEGATQLVVYSGSLAESPTLGTLGTLGYGDTLTLAHLDGASAHLPVPVTIVSHHTLDAHFRAFPDAWAAWYRRYPGSGGLVDLSIPTRIGPADSATLLVGRACGEHCHTVYRVVVARDRDGPWRVSSVVPLALPRD